jgi:hypothetical protein
LKARSPDFRVGDSVVVKTGVTDPDLGTDLGGWQGRISGMAADKRREIFISIRWDSITLKNMPESVIEQCEKKGLDWAERILAAEKAELTTPRDTVKDVARAVAELAAKYAWSSLGEQGRRIQQILEGVDEDDEIAVWGTWARYLRKNLAFPFEAEVFEVQDRGPPQAGDRVTVEKISLVDDLRGVIVRVAYGPRKYAFPLYNLNVIDEDSSNCQFVEDYCVWFANR